MMRKLVFFILLIFSLFILLVGCTVSYESEGNIKISGYVMDAVGTPIENAKVKIGYAQVTTDENGYYQFSKLFTSGTIEIVVKKQNSNYWTEVKEKSIYDSEENFDFYLKDKDVFSGTVSGKINIENNMSSLDTTVNSPDLEDRRDLNKVQSSKVKSQSTTSIKDKTPKYAEGEILVNFKSKVTTSHLEESEETKRNISSLKNDSNTFLIKDENMSAEELYEEYNSRDTVTSVSYNRIGYHMIDNVEPVEPDDDKFDQQWYHWDIYSPEAWSVTTGSTTVTVAVIDTGYIPHEDLDGNIGLEYDMVDNDYDAYDMDAYYNSDSDYNYSKGTHTAGLIGAIGNNNKGIAGVNWAVDIMPIRIFEGQSFKESDLVDAIYYAIDNGADVINLSLAFPADSLETDDDYKYTVKPALEYADSQGVTVVAAAGNGGEDFSYYPASSDYTISVAASGYDLENRAPYSNKGEDLLAPGGNLGDYPDYGGLISTHGYGNSDEDKYLAIDGTSCSTALISGAAALLTAKDIAGPDNILNALQNSADSETGIINIYNALNETVSDDVYDSLQVMAAIKTDNNYYVVSEEENIDELGYYDINKVKTGDKINIVGWADMDNNGTISNGDYFGISSEITLGQEENKEYVDFSVSYVENSYLMSTEEGLPEIIFRPPPEN